MRAQTHPQAGFSLVELSIVLVILGLLTGGILAGQSLIRASELRAVSTEAQKFATAMGTFRDKYFSIPGDMTNATAFGATWLGNGNGDGFIANTAVATTNEISLFWVHIAQAGLVEGSYTNVANTTFTAGTNNPRSKLGQAGWNIVGPGTVGDNGVASTAALTTTDLAASTLYDGSYGNALFFGTGTSAVLPAGTLRSEEAWNVDTKMDDGRPDEGTVRTLESQGNATAGSGCGDLATAVTALAASDYDLTNTSATACSLVIKTGY